MVSTHDAASVTFEDMVVSRGTTIFVVQYRIAGIPGVYFGRVAITPGYTKTSDIPRILAAARTGRPEDAEYFVVIDMREVVQ